MSGHRFGDRAALVDVPDGRTAHRLAGALRALDSVSDAVPTQQSVLVVTRDPAALDSLWGRLTQFPQEPAEPDTPNHHVIEVRYDGPDLQQVAELTGLLAAEVVERHSRARYEVAFLGFAPGFGYLTGLDPSLRLPRLATPRTRVPAGAVAIAEEWTAIYPTASPGGWWLLGRTGQVLFDPADEAAPARLRPGDTVTFRPA